MKTLGEIFLKPLGEPLSAEDDSNHIYLEGRSQEPLGLLRQASHGALM